MEREPVGAERVREIRLEGGWLIAAAVVLGGLLVGAFLLGRATGARRGGALEAGSAAPSRAVVEEPIDVAGTMDHFDRTDRPGQEVDPDREIARAPSPAPAAPPPAATAGRHFVQVWAGREREAAESIVASLSAQGFAVRVFAERAAGDTLYKVRVGGFATEAAARGAAEALQERGFRGAWITTVP